MWMEGGFAVESSVMETTGNMLVQPGSISSQFGLVTWFIRETQLK